MTIDGREFRDALGRFATGVCLITTTTPDGKALALTANSFASVSLDPPLVLWSLQNNSDVYDAYATPKHYAINILSDQQQDLSGRYARKGEHELDPAHYSPGDDGAPLITGALTSFECDLHQTHDGGDHLIIVGRVTRMRNGDGGAPLVFYSGGYRELS